MKKLISYFLLWFVSTGAIAAPYELRITQRDETDSGNFTRNMPPITPFTSAIVMYDGNTLRPKQGAIGPGLLWDGFTLSSAAQVNADWFSVTGPSQILNKPALASVATSGAYADLSGRPSLAPVATSGSYGDLTGRPSLAAVATSGQYSDLSGTPTIPAAQVPSDWTATTGVARILNKPSLALVATSGAYQDLSGRPVLASVATSGQYADLSGTPAIPAAQVPSDWSATTGVSRILNKPTFSAVATTGAYSDLSGRPSLAAVATSGAYADLSGRPTIPAAQVSSDWNATSGVAQVLNKPVLATVATTGSYDDLTNKPSFTPVVGAPTSRTLALATAYQCTNTARSCFVVITLQSQSSISLSGTSNNEGAVTVGATNAVSSGTGTNIATYKNNLGGTLVVGLVINSLQANTYTVAVPPGWFFAVRQTAGSGLQIASAFEQSI